MPVVVSEFAAVGESLILDPVEVATDRVELDLHDGPLMVRPEGPDWGDAEIAGYMAEGERGELPVDFRLPNRKVTIPLSAGLQGVSFNEAREELQAKVARIQQEGGWLKREFADGRKVYLDVVNATLGMGGGSLQAKLELDPDIDLVLETLPDWYGDEVELDQITETTEPEIAEVLKEGGVDALVEGDYPGRVRILVDELQGQDRLGLIWGFRSRHYSAATTARLAYEAEALTPLDTAAVATVTGASGGASNNAVQHTNLGTNWTPVLSTNVLSGNAFLTHTGSYQVRARVRSPDGSAVKLRFVYDVGDLTLPEENAAWQHQGQIPAGGGVDTNWYLADLGQIRLDRVPVGTHRWQGQIQAKGTVGGEDIIIDRVYFQPLDDGAGTLSVTAPAVEGLSNYSARDEFNQSAGALTGKTLPVGGTWTFQFGDTDDYTLDTTGKTAQRSTTADTAARVVSAGTASAAAVIVQANVKATAFDGSMGFGVSARIVDSNNHARAYISEIGGVPYLLINYAAAGVDTALAQVVLPFSLAASTYYTVRLMIDAAGRAFAWAFPTGGAPGSALAFGHNSVFATGGALASGKSGLYDVNTGATASTRNYDNFFVAPPTAEAVVYANQSAELRTEGMVREDATGAAFGPFVPVGDLPRLPPSGLEERPVELFALGSRGDLARLPDSGIDDTRAQVFYRPSWLFVPASAPGS